MNGSLTTSNFIVLLDYGNQKESKMLLQRPIRKKLPKISATNLNPWLFCIY